jgi:hypothetical protein
MSHDHWHGGHYREGFELDPCELAQFLLVGPTQCGEKALCQHLCGHLWIGLLGSNPTFPTGALILEFCRQKLNLFKGR